MAPLATAILEHALLQRDAAGSHITPGGPLPATSSTNTSSGNSGSNVNSATIAGAIVGVVICVGIFAVIASWVSGRERRRRGPDGAGTSLRQQPSLKKSLKQEQVDTFALYRYSSASPTTPSTAKSGCDEKSEGHGPDIPILPKVSPAAARLVSPTAAAAPESNSSMQGYSLTRCVSRASGICSQAIGLAYPPRALTRLPLDAMNGPQCPDGSCSVCLEDFSDGEEVRVLPCIAKHEFHKHCIDPWLLNQCTCPTCRFDLSTLFPKTVEDIEKEAAAAASPADGQQDPVAVRQSPWVSIYR